MRKGRTGKGPRREKDMLQSQSMPRDPSGHDLGSGHTEVPGTLRMVSFIGKKLSL